MLTALRASKYVQRAAQRYYDYCAEIAASPYGPKDKVEFAIISAHCSFESAVRGFLATRYSLGVQELAEALDAAGVMAPYNKAGYIAAYRRAPQFPSMDYQDWRRNNKIRGLAYAKTSFAACLIDPFGSNVVCLDTHMVQYLGAPALARGIPNRNQYEAYESLLLAEAREAGVPPFVYQWATWDWQRGRVEDHSFLWRRPTKAQERLF